MSYTNYDSQSIDQPSIDDWMDELEQQDKNLTDYDKTIAEKLGTIFKDDFARLKPKLAETISAFKDEKDFVDAYASWLAGEEKGKFYDFIKRTFKLEDEDCSNHMTDRAEKINALNEAKEAFKRAREAFELTSERYWREADKNIYDDYNRFSHDWDVDAAEEQKCRDELLASEKKYNESLFSIDQFNSNFGL